MGVPHFTSFCCCMGLEMGTKVIGYMHLCLSLTAMIVCSIYTHGFGQLIGTPEDSGDHLYSRAYQATLVITVVSTGHILLASNLLIGAYKRNTTCLRAWVWIMIVLYLAALIYVFVVTVVYGFRGSGSDIFLSFFEGVVFFSVLAYCIIVVNSFYMMVRSSQEMDQPNKIDY